MNNFGKNMMGGLLIAFYLMCFAFPASLVYNMFQEHLPIEQFLFNQVITFFVIWLIGYFVSELYRDLLANANKPRERDEDENDNRKQNLDKPEDKDESKK